MKINYSKLVEISRVKKTELDLLIKKFQEMIDVRNPKEEPKKIKTLKCNTETSLKTDNVTPSRKRTSKYMTDNEYMEWKRRMLEE